MQNTYSIDIQCIKMYYIKEIWAPLFSGSKLVTASGDTTVKIWDFSKAECVHTFTDHTHAGKLKQLKMHYSLHHSY